ncbi:DNA methyltransferase [Pseudomonas syringae KCTC 12500]|uniref:DNA-methyltransferase n=1 Tax=Pseudomonas syringae TaxID=317 RepID=UPI0004840F84|nr:DNA methyltransferase [Pseudomonas syringae]KMY04300.1 DNA methyltransferase [Pseudomonas syringae KCTC 12500]POR87610.1 site-specific DNA-methyltransferase [Pseudomonas syringae pv. syringae]
MKYELHLGDCLEVMRGLPSNSIDSIVTDPPYGLTSARPGGRSAATQGSVMKGFMGLEWDGEVPSADVWIECLRLLKPGGHLLSFAAARTYHHMAMGIEEAGFEIRDQIMWVFGSGFPKSHNLKGEHVGWGTALKPAHEPICMARKPFPGTVAANVLEHGTGALNIDACRIGVVDAAYARNCSGDRGNAGTRSIEAQSATSLRAGGGSAASGRWPANLIHDGSDVIVGMFPAEAGAAAPVMGTEPTANGFSGAVSYSGMRERMAGAFHGDTGSAARFFYCAKTSRTDRHAGLIDPGPQFKKGTTLRKVETTDTKGNNHPTVKPTDLMAYLLRLVTPLGGKTLDPFMGSGSTGKAAVLEGFDFIGIEQDAAYMAIAKARIAYAQTKRQTQQQDQQLQEQQLSLFSA